MFQGSLFIWYNNVWSRFLCYKYTGADYLASTKHIVEGESIFLFLLHCFFFSFFFFGRRTGGKIKGGNGQISLFSSFPSFKFIVTGDLRHNFPTRFKIISFVTFEIVLKFIPELE